MAGQEDVRVGISAESKQLDSAFNDAAKTVENFGAKVRVSAKEFQQALAQAGGDGTKALEAIARQAKSTQETLNASVQKMVGGDVGLAGFNNGMARFNNATTQGANGARRMGLEILTAGESAAVAHQRVLMFGRDLASGNFEQAGLAVADVALRLGEVSAVAGFALLGIGAVTAGLGYMAYRGVSAREQVEAIGAQMSMMGRGAQFSEQRINSMVRTMSKDFIAYEGDVKRTILTVEQIPQITEQAATKLIALSLTIARATNREPVDVAKEFVTVFSSGAPGLQAFAEKVNLLTAAEKLQLAEAVKLNDAIKAQGIIVDALMQRYDPWFRKIEQMSRAFSAFGLGLRSFMKYVVDDPTKFRFPQLPSGDPAATGNQTDSAKALEATKSITSDLEKRREILKQIETINRGLAGASREEAEILRARAAKLREELGNIGKNQLGVINASSALEMDEFKKNLQMRVQIAREHYDRLAKMRGVGAQETIEAERKLLEAERALQEQYAAFSKLDAEAKRDAANVDLQIEEEKVQAMRQMGLLSSTDEAQRLTELNQRKLQIEIEYLMQVRQLYQDDALQQRQIDQQILRAKQQNRLRQTQIDRGGQEDMRQMWGATWQSIQASAGNAVMGMLQGTMTAGQALQNIFMSVGSTLINSLISMGMQWLATQLGINQLIGISSKISAAAEISNNAGIAGAAATASAAAIPMIGWTIAPGAGAPAAMAAMSYMSFLSVPAAEKGWDVDRDALAYLHKEEMVLPAAQANAVRDMARGGKGNGSPIFNISAVDARSVKRLLMQQGGAVAAAIRRQHRDFNRAVS